MNLLDSLKRIKSFFCFEDVYSAYAKVLAGKQLAPRLLGL